MTDSEKWNFYWSLRSYLGRKVSDAQRLAGWQYYGKSDKVCFLCKKRVTAKDRSIDHIIPKTVCWELGLYRLIIDDRNFRIAHKRCNLIRGHDVSDLPPEILATLKRLGYNPSN